MKILLDMNLPIRFAKMLTTEEIEAIHWFNIGLPDAKDSEIIEYARNNDSIVMTYDLDFSAILAITKGQKPSVIQIRIPNIKSEQTIEMIICALKQNKNELEKGAILTIDTRKARIRLLPL
jgi:predicted nuclease of predicted toxin-antitoxin system